MQKVLITGANGFLGKEVTKILVKQGFGVRCAFRQAKHPEFVNVLYESCLVGDIDITTKWQQALQNIDTVIHLAARVHVMKETEMDPLLEFRKINVEGTKRLASQAAAAGVKRLIFISSVKVNGEKTLEGPFTEESTPKPCDPYGISKWEAEQELQRCSEKTGLELVIIRPPLIYGPGVGGNFLRLLNWVNKGFPLPLKRVNNARSLANVGNVADFILLCVKHNQAAGHTFFVTDGKDMSTSELINQLAEIMNRPSRSFSFPSGLIRTMAHLMGKGAEVERLLGSLQIDDSKARELLGWKSPVSVKEGLSQTVDWYKNTYPNQGKPNSSRPA